MAALKGELTKSSKQSTAGREGMEEQVSALRSSLTSLQETLLSQDASYRDLRAHLVSRVACRC
jgi:hypothetical protein